LEIKFLVLSNKKPPKKNIDAGRIRMVRGWIIRKCGNDVNKEVGREVGRAENPISLGIELHE
jgi:hypothetical protein